MAANEPLAGTVQRSVGNSSMILKTGSDWRRGLDNMLRGELKSWFGTRTWLTQILIWTASINFIYLMTALSMPPEEAPGGGVTMIFNIFMGIVGPIGVSIIMQGAVVGEKNSGTAAWVMSKPVSREAFILSKLIANTLGVAVTMVLAQGAIAYLITGLVVKVWLPVPGFLAALGVHMIHIFFYLSMTLMLGAIFNHGAPVIGIPLAFHFGQQFLMSLLAQISPTLAKAVPWTLAIPGNDSADLAVAGALMNGAPVQTYLPVYVALIASLAFIIIGIRAFQRQEL